MKKFTEKAQDYFDRHPSSDECHITSDGRVFHNKGGALGFAGTLDNQDIESYSRKVLEKAQSVKSDSGSIDAMIEGSKLPEDLKKDVQDIIKTADEARAEKIAELNALELDSSKYNEMKVLVKFFDLKVENQKAETLITALTEFKNSLNQ